MMAMMRDSTVSLVHKDKGSRADLKQYRPIAVNSTLYRINHGEITGGGDGACPGNGHE